MRSMQKATIRLLVVGILFLIPLNAVAASNWQFMNEEYGNKYFIDINSIERKGNSVFYNTKEVYAPGTSDCSYQIITMEYIPNQGIMRYYWEKDYDANGRLVQSVSTTADNPFGPVSPDYTEIQIVNRILAETKNNSQPSQQVSEPLKSVSSSNTVTKFPQEMGGMHLVLARPIASGLYNDDVDLLKGQRDIRCVVVAQPSTYDGGSVRFKLDNGQYVGFSLSYDGKLYFEGIGCQPWQIQGGILTRYKDEQNVFGKMRFDGGMSLGTFGDGQLHVAFSLNNQNRDFTVVLPAGAHYLTGIVSVAGSKAEVAFYK